MSYESLPSDMQRLSVCDVSLDDVVDAPYQPPNTLPLLVKSNFTHPPKVITSLSVPVSHLKANLTSADHHPAPIAPLASTINVEVYRTETVHDKESDESTHLYPTLYVDTQCDVSSISKRNLLQIIADKFQISKTHKLSLKAYDPLLSCWVSIASEHVLGVIVLHCLELNVPLKLSFRLNRPKSPALQKEMFVKTYRSNMKRTDYSKILLPEIKHRAGELPYTFSRPQIQRNELIASTKQDAFADSLEDRLIATRW